MGVVGGYALRATLMFRLHDMICAAVVTCIGRHIVEWMGGHSKPARVLQVRQATDIAWNKECRGQIRYIICS